MKLIQTLSAVAVTGMIAGLTLLSAQAQDPKPAPATTEAPGHKVLVELFTSQG